MSRLQHFPVPLFAMVMGTTGLSIAWRRAHVHLGVPEWPAIAAFWLALVVFTALAVGYAAKWLRHPADAKAELDHPIRMTFMPAITVSLVLLATVAHPVLPGVAEVLWWIGAVAHPIAMLIVVRAWLTREQILLMHVTPAWFIAVVGNIAIPLLGAKLGPVQHEYSLFAYALGLMLWLALLPVVMLRILVHKHPMPPKLLPSLAILVAPPAIGLAATESLFPGVPEVVLRLFYYAALAFVLIVALRIPDYLRNPFGLPAWAFSFPAAAFTADTIILAGKNPDVAIAEIAGWVLLVGVTALIALLYLLTARAIARGGIFVPE